MVGQDKTGRAVRLERDRGRLPSNYFRGWTSAEVRGFLARLLVADGCPPAGAMDVLRLSRTAFYQALRTPPPEHARGIGQGKPLRLEG